MAVGPGQIVEERRAGILEVKRTVHLSGVSTLSMTLQIARNGEPVFGSITRSKQYFTSPASISRPLWKVTPRRILNSWTVGLTAFQVSARFGLSSPFSSRIRSPSYMMVRTMPDDW